MDFVIQAVNAFTTPKRRQASAEDILALAKAKHYKMSFKDIQLAYYLWGSGPVVLLLHGWESRAAHMAAFVPNLIEAGYSAVALDAPAHGESGGAKTSAVDYGQAVAQLASRFSGIQAVIGHSVGSAASLYAFANNLNVKASVHICGPTSMRRVIRRACNAFGLADQNAKQVEFELEREVGCSLDVLSLEQLKRGFVHKALILHDPQDAEVPISESVELNHAWSASSLCEINGVGHRKILKSPLAVEKSTSFIHEHLSGTYKGL